eukprot:6178660-Pleurochrysis_carterae.AAC.1
MYAPHTHGARPQAKRMHALPASFELHAHVRTHHARLHVRMRVTYKSSHVHALHLRKHASDSPVVLLSTITTSRNTLIALASNSMFDAYQKDPLWDHSSCCYCISNEPLNHCSVFLSLDADVSLLLDFDATDIMFRCYPLIRSSSY